MSIVLTLPYPISSNRYWRPVKLGTHITIVPTKEAKLYKATVASTARAMGITTPIEGRYKMEIWLYPNRPQDWKKRMRDCGDAWSDSVLCLDLGNCEKVLSDALNGVAFIDDKWARQIIMMRMEPDEHGARVTVRITAIPTNQPEKLL